MVDSTDIQAGRYKAYPEYKNTFDKWVQRVPKDWEAVPLKYICANPVKDGPHETPTFIDEGIPFLSVDGIQNNKLVFEGCRFISTRDHEKYSRKCKPIFGDVLLGKAASVGKVAFVDTHIEFNVWSPLAVITPKKTAFGEFIFYAFQSSALQAQCDVYSNSNTQKNLGMNTIDNLILPAPSYEEQKQIASFLDYETAKIDTLIEKQQRLIELLTEKRQAVISHAVTKGLNPDVPMKDSGIEWLGEVPEHWEVWKLSHAFRSIGSGTTPSTNDESAFNGNIPWVTTGELRENIITDTLKKVSKQTMEKYSALKIHPSGSVIIAMYGATIGRVAILGVDATTNQACCVLSDSKFIFNKFLFYWLFAYRDEIIQLSSGGGQPNINQEKVSSLKVSAPEVSEQLEIVNYLDDLTLKVDTLIEKSNQQIHLMQERRTALISAAVTGKIDVRDWVKPE